MHICVTRAECVKEKIKYLNKNMVNNWTKSPCVIDWCLISVRINWCFNHFWYTVRLPPSCPPPRSPFQHHYPHRHHYGILGLCTYVLGCMDRVVSSQWHIMCTACYPHGWPSTQPGTFTQPCPIVDTAVPPLFTQPCPGRTMSTAVCIYVAGLCANCPAV